MQKSRLSDYALGIMLYMKEGERYKVEKISQDLKLNFPTVAKILKMLKKNQLMSTSLGKHGGYLLKSNKNEISVLDVIWAIDGKKSWAKCLENSCILKSSCTWKESVIDVQKLEERIFQLITLKDLEEKNNLVKVLQERINCD